MGFCITIKSLSVKDLNEIIDVIKVREEIQLLIEL